MTEIKNNKPSAAEDASIAMMESASKRHHLQKQKNSLMKCLQQLFVKKTD